MKVMGLNNTISPLFPAAIMGGIAHLVSNTLFYSNIAIYIQTEVSLCTSITHQLWPFCSWWIIPWLEEGHWGWVEEAMALEYCPD